MGKPRRHREKQPVQQNNSTARTPDQTARQPINRRRRLKMPIADHYRIQMRQIPASAAPIAHHQMRAYGSCWPLKPPMPFAFTTLRLVPRDLVSRVARPPRQHRFCAGAEALHLSDAGACSPQARWIPQRVRSGLAAGLVKPVPQLLILAEAFNDDMKRWSPAGSADCSLQPGACPSAGGRLVLQSPVSGGAWNWLPVLANLA